MRYTYSPTVVSTRDAHGWMLAKLEVRDMGVTKGTITSINVYCMEYLHVDYYVVIRMK